MSFFGFGFVGGQVFAPTDIANCGLWLDASDSSTITISSGVSQWNDKSGNGRNLTQGTAANRPTVQSAGLNGRDYISFDGTNDALSATWSSQATPMTAFGVSRLRANDAFAAPLGALGDGATGSTINFDLSSSGNTYRMYAGSIINGTAGGASNNVWYYFTAQWNGASSFTRASGTQVLSGNAGSATASGFYVGSESAATVHFPLDIAELIWYTRALNSTEYGQVESYLKSKWGL